MNANRHQKPTGYEAVATVAGLLGAFLLAMGLMPFTNPGFLEVNATGEYSPRMEFIVPTLLSLPLLGLAWRFNMKAKQIRKDLEPATQTSASPWEKKLKWILFGIVALVVLSAFLW